MSTTTMAVALKIIANNAASSEIKKITGELGSMAVAAVVAHKSFSAFKSIGKYMLDGAKGASEFNKELKMMSLNAQNNTHSVKEFYKSIYDNAQRTGVNSKELASGYKLFASGGYSASQVNSMMKPVGDLSALSGASSENIARSVMQSAKYFGLDASESSTRKTLDAFYKTSKLSTLNLDDLSGILAKIGTSAKLAGVSLDETLALSGGLGASGEDSGVVGTMGNSILKIFNNSKVRSGISQATGVKFFDETGQKRGVFDVLGELQGAYSKMGSDKDKNGFIDNVFADADARTKQGIVSILNTDGSVEKMKAMYKDIKKSGGEITKDLKEINDEYGAQVNRITEFFTRTKNSAGLIFGDAAKKPLTGIADFLEGKDAGKLVAGGAALTGTAAIIATMFGGGKLVGPAKALLGFGTNAVAAQAAEKTMGAQKVFVVNMPAGGLRGGDASLLSTALPAAAKAIPAIPAAAGLGAGITAAGLTAAAIAAAPVVIPAVLGAAVLTKALTDKRDSEDIRQENLLKNPRYLDMVKRGVIKDDRLKVENHIYIDRNGETKTKTLVNRVENHEF